MATIFGNGIDLKDTELLNALLTNVRLTEGTDAPEPGDLRLVGDVPHYVNALGVVRPIHEDSLTSIDGGDGPITFEINGRTATAAIAPADIDSPGTLSAEHYTLLNGATADNYIDTLVLRNSAGGADFGSVNAGFLQASSISANTIEAPIIITDSTLEADTVVPNKGYVRTQIQNALTEAAANITAITPLSVAPSAADPQVVEIAIAPADATNPGALSPEHYALLANASGVNSPYTLVRRDEDGSVSFGALVEAREFRILNEVPLEDRSATSVAYVRNQIQLAVRDAIAGMDRKAQGVRLAFATNLPLTTTSGTYQGVPLTPNDSILLFGQTNPAENGPYSFTNGGLVRRSDSNNATNFTTGALYQVEAGDYANHAFSLITQPGFVIDQDPLTFLDLSGVNVLRGSSSVQIVDQIVSITPAYDTSVNDRISTAIAPLQDEAEVQALINAAITANNANNKHVTVIGDGVATSFVIEHNLGKDIDVSIWENKFPGDKVYTDVSRETVNSIRLTFGSPPAPQSYEVVVKA